jgi:hypothetical protein
MKLTRRALAKSIGAVALPGALATQAQAQPAAPEAEETVSARTALRANLDQIAKVKIPREVEPATRFSTK